MKIILLSIFIVISTLSVFGQLEKSTWLIGGNANFFSNSQKWTYPTFNLEGKVNNIECTATLGYFPTDKFSLGIKPLLSVENGRIGDLRVNDFRMAIGPFIRYYFLKDDKQFNILTDLSYQLGIYKDIHDNSNDRTRGKYNTLSIMAGAELFFNSAVGLEILLGYKNQIISIPKPSIHAFTSQSSGFQTTIGFQFHLLKN